MTDRDKTGKYSATLADLEASVRVPVEDQVTEQAEPPTPGIKSQGEVDRETFLRIAGAP